MIQNIAFSFSSTENAWVSSQITLQNNIDLRIKLKSNGWIVIKKKNSATASFPKVFISSKLAFDEVIPICGDVSGKIIQVFTETEPESIKAIDTSEASTDSTT